MTRRRLDPSGAWTRAWRSTLRAASSIRFRVLAVVLAAFCPLAVVSGLFAWQSYQAASRQSERRIADILLGFTAGRASDITDVRGVIEALAAMPALHDPAICDIRLRLALRLGSQKIVGLAARDATGVVCRVGDAIPDPVVGGAATGEPGAGNVVLGPVRREPAGGRFVFDAAAHGAPAAAGGALVVSAAVRIDAMVGAGQASGARIWMLDGAGAVWPAADGIGAPGPAVIRRLLDGRDEVVTHGPLEARWIFMIGRLPDGGRFVLGDRATAAEARSLSLLLDRSIAIALLLLIGVAAVAAGAHLFVAAPVRALTRRVTTWRASGVFDDGHMRFVPGELGSLIRAFGDATASISAREADLRRATTAQELAIKEIHHRVKNNLQIVASLLNLQSNRIRQPEARAEFQSARDRVKALATLHRHLYGEGGVHTIAMRPFLLELCGQLFQAMGEREGQRITLDIEAPELEMTSDQAVPLALIITEAVSNSLKYAFPAGRSGAIEVRLASLGDDEIALDIVDDGIGIPAGRAETETGIRDGLGLTLIRGFARQLGASLEVTEAAGTRYHLTMTLQREREEAGAAAA